MKNLAALVCRLRGASFTAGLVLAAAGCATTPDAHDIETAEIHYALGVEAANHNDNIEARREFMVALEKNPVSHLAYNALGTLDMLGRRHPEAEANFKRAIELKHDYSEARNNLGTLYSAQKRYPEAISEFKKALENPLYPTPYAAEMNLAWALYHSGKQDDAILQLRNTIIANSKFCRPHRELGLMYRELGKNSEAIESFERYGRMCQDEKERRQEAFLLTADAQRDMGNREAARASYERCRALGVDTDFGAECGKAQEKLAGP